MFQTRYRLQEALQCFESKGFAHDMNHCGMQLNNNQIACGAVQSLLWCRTGSLQPSQVNTINTLVTYPQNSEVAMVSTQDVWTKSSQIKVGFVEKNIWLLPIVCIIIRLWHIKVIRVIAQYVRAFAPWDPTYHFHSVHSSNACPQSKEVLPQNILQALFLKVC